MIEFYSSYRFVLVFGIACCLLALVLFACQIATGRPGDFAIPGILLFTGVLAAFVGGVLKNLTNRIEALESRDDHTDKRG